MISRPEQVTVIGLGLIGGSLGMAVKKYLPECRVKGYARRPETAALAEQKGAIDEASATLKDAVAGARLVVIATPVLTTKDIFKEIAPLLGPDAIVTDVGSTKSAVMELAREYLPRGISFIGGHPMAGKENSGIEFAEADLFVNKVYCLTPAQDASHEALAYVKNVVTGIKARPLVVEPGRHDHFVAGISHLPFLLSVALMDVCSHDPSWSEMSELASSGFRDMTRLASGDPVMYRDICATNAEEISDFIDDLCSELQATKPLLHDPNGIAHLFARARQARENWLKGQ